MVVLEDQANLLGNYLSYEDFVYELKRQLEDGIYFFTKDLPEMFNSHKYHLAEKHRKLPCCVDDITRRELIPYLKRAEKEKIHKVIKYHKHNKELPVIITPP